MTGRAPVRLSVVVLAWDNVELTRRCAASVRAATVAAYELVVVDNGSAVPGPAVAEALADVAILHPENRGFAAGMNAGLARARGDFVAFVNNDTLLPAGWDTPLLEQATRPTVGVVVPAVTAAGHRVGVRREPGTEVRVLPPFREVPSGVVYLLRTNVVRALGGWDERYHPAGAEDADLCFRVWLNGLDVVLDERVLVEHVGKATVARLPDRSTVWTANRKRLLQRWRSGAADAAVLPGSDQGLVARRRQRARVMAWAMTLHFATVDRLPEPWKRALLPALRTLAAGFSAMSHALASRHAGRQ